MKRNINHPIVFPQIIKNLTRVLIKVLAFNVVLLTSSVFAQSKDIVFVPDEEQASFQREEKVALLVGISNYLPNSGLSPLQYADDDAKALAKTFEELGYKVRVLTDAQAVSGVINKELRNLGQYLKRGEGTFVFAFSGHGFARDDVNYLAPYEATDSNITTVGLKLTDILKTIKQTGVKRQILLIDACRNDPGGTGSKSTSLPGFVDFEEAEGHSILFSTKFGSKSWEYKQLGHGVFTHYIMQGLRGDASKKGLVTFQGLADYVSRNVKDYGFKYHNDQVPFWSGEAFGDFLMAKLDPSAITSARETKLKVPSVALKPGQVFQDTLKDGSKGPQMVVVPAGSFRMGNVSKAPIRDDVAGVDEKPVHKVKFAKAFAIGVFEVSYADYDKYSKASGLEKLPDFGWGRGTKPVAGIIRDDSEAYAIWLSQQTGYKYRLPTEAEWEYAARAGTKTRYWWGNKIGKNRAACDGCGSKWDKRQTARVKSFKPNKFGLYNVHGNVAEWVIDCWHDNYKGAPKDGSAWRDENDGNCDFGILRGGHFGSYPGWIRSANRFKHDFFDSTRYMGFRLVRELN